MMPPFFKTHDWMKERDPALAEAVTILARHASDSMWQITKDRSRAWCRETSEGNHEVAHRIALAIYADAKTYVPEPGRAAA